MTTYITFAYSRKLPSARLVGPTCDTFTGEGYTSLARLHVLGARSSIHSLKHATLEEIKRLSTLLEIDTTATFPGPGDIDNIYDGTSEGDPARRLNVDMLAENVSSSWLGPECHQTLVLDLVRELLNESRGSTPFCVPAHPV
jgi:hypothetical protein